MPLNNMIEKITSTSNQKIKKYLKLKQKKYQDEYDLFLVYGNHLIFDAINIVDIISSDINYPNITIYVDDLIMKKFSNTETVINSVCVCKKIKEKDISSNNVLLFDDIQDPGNAGTLLRSASAFGFSDVIFSQNSVSQYNHKLIRSSQGAIFHLNIIRDNIKDKIIFLKKKGYKIIAADSNSSNYNLDKLSDKVCLILGNESNGISNDIYNLIDEFVSIKTINVESLNVAIAGAIIMHKWSIL